MTQALHPGYDCGSPSADSNFQISDMAHPNHPHPPHPFQADHHEPVSDDALLGIALCDLLIEKGLWTADDERLQIEQIDAITPALGARVVTRSWVDPAYRARLLADAYKASEELGIDAGYVQMTALENTENVHNLVVCTLCSCYPRTLLGRPPTWYKSSVYRARAVREPRMVLAEWGTHIAPDREVRVHDSTAELRYIVIPMRPAGTENWSEEELQKLISRDSMIGVAEALSPKHKSQ